MRHHNGTQVTAALTLLQQIELERQCIELEKQRIELEKQRIELEKQRIQLEKQQFEIFDLDKEVGMANAKQESEAIKQDYLWEQQEKENKILRTEIKKLQKCVNAGNAVHFFDLDMHERKQKIKAVVLHIQDIQDFRKHVRKAKKGNFVKSTDIAQRLVDLNVKNAWTGKPMTVHMHMMVSVYMHHAYGQMFPKNGHFYGFRIVPQ